MARYMKITLEKRNVSCVARMLDYEAPETAELVWNALPSARRRVAREVRDERGLLPRAADRGRGAGAREFDDRADHGDVVYFYFPKGHLARSFREEKGFADLPGVVDLAVFYGRNNFLFNPSTGYVPGNVVRHDRRGHGRDGEGDARRLAVRQRRRNPDLFEGRRAFIAPPRG